MTIRALFQATKVEGAASPYDTIHLKVFYPAQMSGSNQEQNLGEVPADARCAPFQVVILFNGINCGPELYQWMAVKLAERGLVVVIFSWIAENLPGMIALTPGVDLKMLAPNAYGKGPTASALPSLLTALEQLQAEGILAGLLDLNQIILGGHSAGGRVAIESASTGGSCFCLCGPYRRRRTVRICIGYNLTPAGLLTPTANGRNLRRSDC
jgi:predicted dienelactone hydrolase